MLILSRKPWTTDGHASALEGHVRDLLRYANSGEDHVVLLPVGEVEKTAPIATGLKTHLATIAQQLNVTLAAAGLVEDEGALCLRGFVIDPHGETQLEVQKTLPDLGLGFSDETTKLSDPRDFDIAATPGGKVALLIGEDILSPHLVRASALAGAEIILNPTRERVDATLKTKRTVRAARAYENIMYVASTSAAGGPDELSPLADTTGLFDFNGKEFLNTGNSSSFYADIDIQELRRRRQEPFANFLEVHRSSLYAREYKASAEPPAKSPPSRDEWQAEGKRRTQTSAADAPVYDVVAVQSLLRNVPDVAHKDEVIDANLNDSLAIARNWARAPNVKLVVFPEFWMQGVHFQRSLKDWTKVAITLPGKETERLSELAQEFKCYVAGAAFEYDPDWPDRWFNTAFIINDSGDLIHRYRKIQCGDTSGLMNNSTPGNLLSAYLDKYGLDYLFPVADTPLGKLATIICFDMNFPETARAMVKRGAEVIIHPTAEPHNTRRHGWDKGRRARAFENTAYVVSAAIGGEYRNHKDLKPEFFHRGYSKVVKFDGTIDAIVEGPGEVGLVSKLDLGALRHARANPLLNLAAWDEPQVYGGAYASHAGFPEDVWLKRPMQLPIEGIAETRKVIERYTKDGIFESA